MLQVSVLENGAGNRFRGLLRGKARNGLELYIYTDKECSPYPHPTPPRHTKLV